ncbi:hypothetical protein PR202_gb04362 [Eleusine coracana subsp. coracana]|uniref:HMA domain-containing protein n=1 Tax=Eleusine coracana subsp. coracana TaxID=191504 RepID=A0AAV5E562_ELECO|nr:hypothetical protein PR202_gb04362 [Eleusine coracana subsp. coracana]
MSSSSPRRRPPRFGRGAPETLRLRALNIHDYVLGDVIGAAGIVLCFLGLLYGGFWRIQMRKTFGLPRSRWFCGSASLTDYVQWLFCWPCALAQEVRTGNLYDVEDGNFYEILRDNAGDMKSEPGSTVATDLPVPMGSEEGNDTGVTVGLDGEMIPPTQPVVELKVGMHCERCIKAIKKAIKTIDDMESYQLETETNKVTVTGNITPEEVVKALQKIGKTATSWAEE